MANFQYHIFSPYRVCPLGAHVDHQHGLVTGFAINSITLKPFEVVLIASEAEREYIGLNNGLLDQACIALVDPAYKENIEKELHQQYLAQFPEYEQTFDIFWVRPDDGAKFVEEYNSLIRDKKNQRIPAASCVMSNHL